MAKITQTEILEVIKKIDETKRLRCLKNRNITCNTKVDVRSIGDDIDFCTLVCSLENYFQIEFKEKYCFPYSELNKKTVRDIINTIQETISKKGDDECGTR